MLPWLFLAGTIVCALITLQVLGLFECWGKRPRHFLNWVYGEKTAERMEAQASDEQKKDMVYRWELGTTIFWVGITLFLGSQTFRAFMQ
ncbi:MAG: hypothetical protein KGL40_02665 [Rhodocyclaceae bacterium]|nr:hypothetical protein [Rhodocyclaceae bacterium]